jgi:Phosphotransferase enzyme family
LSRRADIRFAAPELPSRAAVRDEAWRHALQAVGVDVVDLGEPAPFALAANASELQDVGYRTTEYVLRPEIEDPTLVLRRDYRKATRYALLHATGSSRGWRRLRNRVAAATVSRVAMPVTAKTGVAVGTHRTAAPAFVQAAAEFGVPESSEWFMTLGRGDELSRNSFFLFPPDSAKPAWVLKFVRVPGYSEPFDRDQRGLALAQSSAVAAAHAPRLLARFAIDGLDASLETACVGEPLRRLLEGSALRSAKLAAIGRVAEWIVTLGANTLAPPAALEPERERLATDVLPHWQGLGADAELLTACADVGAVLQHNDLGSWNIVVDASSFGAVDWEAAREHGLPLWDLAYFLVDAIATLDRVKPDEWSSYVPRLFRGELPHSRVLLAWIRRGAEAARVPDTAVGRIVLLGWLHHGLSHKVRGEALTNMTSSQPGPIPRAEEIASIWLTQPGLGPDWSAWRD